MFIKKNFIKIFLLTFSVLATMLFINACQTKNEPITKTALIFDTDLGTDDAIAMAIMKKNNIVPNFVIVSGGNASSENAIRNAIIMKKFLSLDTIAVKGVEIKLSDEKNTFHGEDGLANISEQMIKDYKISNGELNNFISINECIEKLKEYDKIEYIVVGPPTTLAYLLDIPEVDKKISNIYMMGGGINEFNCSHDTEFNFSKNPKAVKRVLESKHHIVLFPLDITNRQVLDEKMIENYEKSGLRKELITFLKFNRNSNNIFNKIDGAVMHDSTPVIYYINKNLFKTEKCNIVSDEYGHIEKRDDGNPVDVIVAFDSEKVLENDNHGVVPRN